MATIEEMIELLNRATRGKKAEVWFRDCVYALGDNVSRSISVQIKPYYGSATPGANEAAHYLRVALLETLPDIASRAAELAAIDHSIGVKLATE